MYLLFSVGIRITKKSAAAAPVTIPSALLAGIHHAAASGTAIVMGHFRIKAMRISVAAAAAPTAAAASVVTEDGRRRNPA